MISGIEDSSATCTLTASLAGATATATSMSTAGHGVSYCGLMAIKTSALGAGDWTLRVSVVSTGGSGVSASSSLTVR
jgi:hypothetical protein